MNRTLVDYTPEMESFDFGEPALEPSERSGEPAVFDETDEIELAAQLLEVSDESELDRFLGKLVGKAGRALGQAVASPAGQALGGILKGAARQALPVVDRALGDQVDGNRGARSGAGAGAAAGRIFGLEFEGLSPEDMEFEATRAFVRFGADAVRRTLASAGPAAPKAAVRDAVVAAARRLAPGLLRGQIRRPARTVSGAPTGRWMRQGRNIIVVGG